MFFFEGKETSLGGKLLRGFHRGIEEGDLILLVGDNLFHQKPMEKQRVPSQKRHLAQKRNTFSLPICMEHMFLYSRKPVFFSGIKKNVFDAFKRYS